MGTTQTLWQHPTPSHNSSIPRWSLLALLAAFALAGCGAPDDVVSEPADSKPVATGPVEVVMVDLNGYKQEIAKHEGKIVVVDFWATWCEPCKERFPHMVEMSHQFPASDVTFVSVSLDFAGQDAKVVEFLSAQNASSMTNLMTTLETSEAFDAYEIEDGIPNYKIFDRSGVKKYSFSQFPNEKKGLLATEMLDIKLREMLAE